MASRIENILGESVIKNNGDKVCVKSLCGKDKIVGVYFSAHWCPPCRSFTPKLTEFYKNLKSSEKGNTFEIVFVSWKQDDAGFQEYFATMPWLAVPYTDRDRRERLTKKFRVQGIPRFVLLDGETGKMITADGYAHLQSDENGEEFPWRMKPFNDMIKGKLLRGNEEVDACAALNGKIVGLYFAAHWCPPCRYFTPELLRFYEKLKEEQRNFEIIFVSSDRSQESFEQYFSCMPWLALPFDDTRQQQLTNQIRIEGIPTLVMIDEKGNVITVQGRPALLSDRNGSEFPWYPKPMNELTENTFIQLNESVCLVFFTEGEDEEIERAKEVLTEVATREHQKGEDQELFFFYGGSDEEFCDQVRDFADLDDRSPLLVILDLPDQQVFTCVETNITKEVATDFVDSYLARKLTPRSLRQIKMA